MNCYTLKPVGIKSLTDNKTTELGPSKVVPLVVTEVAVAAKNLNRAIDLVRASSKRIGLTLFDGAVVVAHEWQCATPMEAVQWWGSGDVALTDLETLGLDKDKPSQYCLPGNYD